MKTEKFELASGLIVFFLGIGLLCFTFFLTFITFVDPSRLFHFRDLIPSSVNGEYESLVEVLVYFLAALILWVMGSIGGRITKTGIEMYRAYKLKEERLMRTRARV